MVDNRFAPLGIFILRLALGILFFAHLGLKIFVFTPAGFVGFFGSLGLPAIAAYGTMLLEFVVAVSLVFGIMPRIGALLGLLPILGAIAMVHGPAGFWFTNPNGGWEYLGLWAVALVVVALAGDGKYALKPSCKTLDA